MGGQKAGPQSGVGDSFLKPAPCGAGLSRRLQKVPGGYLWWYADLVDGDGNGVVVIWSFGLPFLPGYAQAIRRGCAPTPEQRPSLNVAVYRRGELDFYLLQEFEPQQVRWRTTEDGDQWRFGASHIRSVAAKGYRKVKMDLRLDVPGLGEEASLKMRGSGPAVRRPDGGHDPMRRQCRPLPVHDWVPLVCNCRAEAQLRAGGDEVTIRGRLYHDRNGGSVPLQQLPLRYWTWGRVALSRGEFVYYTVETLDGEHHSALWSIDDRGRLFSVPEARLCRQKRAKNFFGLSWWQTMSVDVAGKRWLNIEHRHLVDSGPFYLRTLSRAVDRRGREFAGVGEVCAPGRIDLARHRPLVKMRVHRRQRRNSMWLPLFVGPRKGRLQRLLRSWVSRAG